LDVYCTGRTYPEVFYSGLLPRDAVADLVAYGSQVDGVFTAPQQWCTFNSMGWGYGLLQHDYVEQFLVFTFAVSAHAQTRGTWTAAECIGSLDRSQSSSGYAAPSQATLPLLMKWMLLFEDPLTQTLWIGKALPREWLASSGAAGPGVQVEGAPTRYGRVGFHIRNAGEYSYEVSITLAHGFQWPPGGIRLRLRSPAFPAKKLSSATVGGIALPSSGINATDETLAFAEPPPAGALQRITAAFA